MARYGEICVGHELAQLKEGVERVVAAEAVGMEEEVVVRVVEGEVEVEVGWRRRRRR